MYEIKKKPELKIIFLTLRLLLVCTFSLSNVPACSTKSNIILHKYYLNLLEKVIYHITSLSLQMSHLCILRCKDPSCLYNYILYIYNNIYIYIYIYTYVNKITRNQEIFMI